MGDAKVNLELEIQLALKPNHDGKDLMQNKINEFDDILQIVGTKGKFQQWLVYGFICPVVGLTPLVCLSGIFLLFIPDHWCYQAGIEAFNETELIAWKEQNLPRIVGAEGHLRFSQCEMFAPSGNGSIINCPAGWAYDRSEFTSTIPSAYDWVCSRDHFATHVFTAVALGTVVGNIVFGLLADKVGRKLIFFLSLFVYLVFRMISFFVPQNFWIFIGLNFLSGTGFPLTYMIPGMLIAELSDDEYRSFTASVCWGVWVTGMAALPYVAYLCSDWFLIAMVTTVPLFLVFLYIPFVPESARWLVSAGRIQDAAGILRKVAEVNGNSEKLASIDLDAVLRCIVLQQHQADHKHKGFWTLFSKRRLALTTLLLTASWTINMMIYELITLNTPNMSGDQFFNFFLLSVIEVPSSILGGYLLSTLGRRWTQVIFFLFSGVTCFVAGVAVGMPDISIVVIVSTLIAKFAVTITFLVIYLQATELFPTPLRATGNSFCGTIGAVFAMLCPTVVYLGRYNAGAPYMIMGIMSILGMFASAFLKETLGQTLPETIEEADSFGEDHQFWSIHPNRDKKKKIAYPEGQEHEISALQSS